jgi:hypothetical protein
MQRIIFLVTEKGLQYAISVDNESPQIIGTNKEDTATGSGIWNAWVAENIIIKSSKHIINKPGKHTVKYWMVDGGIVLQSWYWILAILSKVISGLLKRCIRTNNLLRYI